MKIGYQKRNWDMSNYKTIPKVIGVDTTIEFKGHELQVNVRDSNERVGFRVFLNGNSVYDFDLTEQGKLVKSE